jgi:cell division protein FtsI/penicillin-binding protein 2
MSALAGLQKLGTNPKPYNIDWQELVDATRDQKTKKVISVKEPYNQRDGNKLKREVPNLGKTHEITMEDAIVLSSNNYFINLVNDQKLYSNLDNVYQTVGIRIDKPYSEIINGKTKQLSKALTPYFLTKEVDKNRREEYKGEISSVGNEGVRTYNDYIKKRNKDRIYEQMSGYHNGHDWNKLAWAWGQGSMSATPLNMARVASIVANGGNFVETQFPKQGNKTLKTEKPEIIRIVSEKEANILKGYMEQESTKHKIFPAGMGGKTGTPERDMKYQTTVIDKKTGKSKTITVYGDIDTKRDGKMNDGWYIFFINSPKEKAPLAVAIRMERLGAGVSGNAVRLADKVVLKVLSDVGYLN